MNIEIIGTIASIIILISFISNKIYKIRIINIIGCTVFIIYGILIKSFSVLLLNSALMLIHVYYLIKEYKNVKKSVKK